jgi:hypothetical protein
MDRCVFDFFGTETRQKLATLEKKLDNMDDAASPVLNNIR